MSENPFSFMRDFTVLYLVSIFTQMCDEAVKAINTRGRSELATFPGE